MHPARNVFSHLVTPSRHAVCSFVDPLRFSFFVSPPVCTFICLAPVGALRSTKCLLMLSVTTQQTFVIVSLLCCEVEVLLCFVKTQCGVGGHVTLIRRIPRMIFCYIWQAGSVFHGFFSCAIYSSTLLEDLSCSERIYMVVSVGAYSARAQTEACTLPLKYEYVPLYFVFRYFFLLSLSWNLCAMK